MKVKGFFIFVICIIIYCIPMVLVIDISNSEQKKYLPEEDFNFDITSYGIIKQVCQMDVEEYVTLDLTATCINVHSLSIDENYTILCNVGDEVKKGNVLAKFSSSEIVAEFNGYITDIEYGDIIALKYYDFNDMVYETYIDVDDYKDFEDYNLKDSDGNKIKFLSMSNIVEDNKVKIYLSIPKETDIFYGQCLEGVLLYTGNIYKNATVVEKDCIFQKDSAYYVRLVNEKGIFLQDIEVKVGFNNDNYICVSSDDLTPGDYCDSGYSVVSEESEESIVDEEY